MKTFSRNTRLTSFSLDYGIFRKNGASEGHRDSWRSDRDHPVSRSGTRRSD